MPAGQPTKYKPEYAEQARKLCLLGYTDQELASFFGVTERTINNWKDKHSEFFQSITKGKDIADSDVADALYNRALGYSHPEVKVFCNNGQIFTWEGEKHYPPDTGAAFIWLKNRQSGRWKDKHEHDINMHDDSALFEGPEGEIEEL